MSEPIDFYGVAWPRPDTSREELAKLRAELEATAARWIAVAHTDQELIGNQAFTECQRELLRGAGSALRRCARELREVIKGENENLG